MRRTSFFLVVALLSAVIGVDATVRLKPDTTGTDGVNVTDLDGRAVDPFAITPATKATVLIFLSVECPVSNRYAPEVRRLYDSWVARGISIWLVFPNPTDSPQAIRAHLKAFNFPPRALRDPRHELAKFAGATVTPEAAVYDREQRLAYRGRIDDRYVSIGVERPAATRHDLELAVAALLDKRPIAAPRTEAVGCFIADFVP